MTSPGSRKASTLSPTWTSNPAKRARVIWARTRSRWLKLPCPPAVAAGRAALPYCLNSESGIARRDTLLNRGVGVARRRVGGRLPMIEAVDRHFRGGVFDLGHG